MMSDDDFPIISPSNDSTQIELTPQKEAKVTEPIKQAARPAAAAAPQGEPRKGTELRKPAVTAPAAPARPASTDNSASRPAAPSVRPAAAAPTGDDDDGEKLLREYADRQKTKMVKLEQQLAEYKKIVAERDAFKAKADSLTKELAESKRQLDASAKNEEVIKDLQGKVDAAILSNSILSEDKEKLKKALAQQTEFLKKAEDKSAATEKSLADVEKQLAEESEAREAAESKVDAALAALQGGAPAAKAPAEKPVSEAATRPMPSPAAPKSAASEEKPAAAPAKAPPAKPAAAPGRFSFLKK